MFFPVVVQQAKEIFTKGCRFTVGQAVLQDLAEVLRVRVFFWIVRKKMPWLTLFPLGALQWGSVQSFFSLRTSNQVVIDDQRLKEFAMWI